MSVSANPFAGTTIPPSSLGSGAQASPETTEAINKWVKANWSQLFPDNNSNLLSFENFDIKKDDKAKDEIHSNAGKNFSSVKPGNSKSIENLFNQTDIQCNKNENVDFILDEKNGNLYLKINSSSAAAPVYKSFKILDPKTGNKIEDLALMQKTALTIAQTYTQRAQVSASALPVIFHIGYSKESAKVTMGLFKEPSEDRVDDAIQVETDSLFLQEDKDVDRDSKEVPSCRDLEQMFSSVTVEDHRAVPSDDQGSRREAVGAPKEYDRELEERFLALEDRSPPSQLIDKNQKYWYLFPRLERIRDEKKALLDEAITNLERQKQTKKTLTSFLVAHKSSVFELSCSEEYRRLAERIIV